MTYISSWLWPCTQVLPLGNWFLLILLACFLQTQLSAGFGLAPPWGNHGNRGKLSGVPGENRDPGPGSWRSCWPLDPEGPMLFPRGFWSCLQNSAKARARRSGACARAGQGSGARLRPQRWPGWLEGGLGFLGPPARRPRPREPGAGAGPGRERGLSVATVTCQHPAPSWQCPQRRRQRRG